jgi:hypothetical protein
MLDNIEACFIGDFYCFLDSKPLEIVLNDSINNNTKKQLDTAVKEHSISPDKKIIIQKIEVVNLEKIPTDQPGRLRRISSLFEEAKQKDVAGTMKVSNGNTASEENNDIESTLNEIGLSETSETVQNPPEYQTQDPPVIKLLSAKIPENQFNKKVPLKIVRKIKPPKPKPTLRNRFHRVETFVPPIAQESNAIDSSSDFELETLVPDLKVEEEQKQAELPISMTDRNFSQSSSFQEVKEVSNLSEIVENNSDNEENFRGFDNDSITTLNPHIEKWYQALILGPLNHFKKTDENIETSTTEPTPSISCKFKEIAPQEFILFPQKSQIRNSSPSKSFQVKDREVEHLTTKVFVANPVKLKPCSSKRTSDSQPSTSQKLKTDATKIFVNEPEWQNDLLVVIGRSRLLEIDTSLRAIPNIVTGNAIETENVELRLIVKHLLKKFQIKSLMETIQGEQETDYLNNNSTGKTSSPKKKKK